MTTDGVKKTKSWLSQETINNIVNSLDKKDGKIDQQIPLYDWNVFADFTGVDKESGKDSVPVEKAYDAIEQLSSNNAAKLVNYSREYLNIDATYKPQEPETKEYQTKDKNMSKMAAGGAILLDSMIKGMMASHPVLLAAGVASKIYKPATDYIINNFMQKQDVETIKKLIVNSAKACTKSLPLASQLLHISVNDEDTTLGKHGDYTVIDAAQSRKKLDQLGLHENDTNIYGRVNEHLMSDKMGLKTLVFDNKSKASQVVSKSELVAEATKHWDKKGSPNKSCYMGVMNNTSDELLGLNTCFVLITDKKDNGKDVTYKGYVEDVYDYAERYNRCGKLLTDQIDSLNYAAYIAQERGIIKPYRVLIPFEVTKPK